MTRFCAISTGRLLGHTMKFTSFPISDDWLIKAATCVTLVEHGYINPKNLFEKEKPYSKVNVYVKSLEQ